MEARQWEPAERYLLQAIATEPENAKTHYLLALTRQAKGDLPGARAAIAEALRLKPAQPEFLALAKQL
jgi:Flp pilus assembly protein TadD